MVLREFFALCNLESTLGRLATELSVAASRQDRDVRGARHYWDAKVIVSQNVAPHAVEN